MIANGFTARAALERLWRDIPVGSGMDLNIVQTYMEELERIAYPVVQSSGAIDSD